MECGVGGCGRNSCSAAAGGGWVMGVCMSVECGVWGGGAGGRNGCSAAAGGARRRGPGRSCRALRVRLPPALGGRWEAHPTSGSRLLHEAPRPRMDRAPSCPCGGCGASDARRSASPDSTAQHSAAQHDLCNQPAPDPPDSGSLSSPIMPSKVSHRVALLTTVLPLRSRAGGRAWHEITHRMSAHTAGGEPIEGWSRAAGPAAATERWAAVSGRREGAH